jgi:hypothetical protein
VIVQKLNMPSPPRQLVQSPSVISIEQYLHPLQSLDLVSEVVAQTEDLLLAEISLEEGRVERHEAVIFGADENHLAEIGNMRALG